MTTPARPQIGFAIVSFRTTGFSTPGPRPSLCPNSTALSNSSVLCGSLGTTCRYVIVRNPIQGDTLPLFDASKVRQKLRHEFGAREITIPESIAHILSLR